MPDQKKNKTAGLGIDIDTTGVRMVELTYDNTALTLRKFGFLSTPGDLVSNLTLADQDSLSSVITQLKSRLDPITTSAVAAVPSAGIFCKAIKIPEADSQDLPAAVRARIGDYLPTRASEIKLDWYVVGSNDDQAELTVLVVAAPTAMVDKYVTLIGRSGLSVEALETNHIAIGRSVVKNPEYPIAIIDFGDKSVELSVIWRKIPYATGLVDIGESSFVQAIAQGLNIDNDQASQFMYKFGLSETILEGQVFKAIKHPLDEAINGLSGVIGDFYDYGKVAGIEKVVLTGKAATIPGVTGYVSQSVGLPAEIANPWTNINLSEEQSGLLADGADDSHQFAVAAGLALRNLI